ncbi:hypothetical protein L9F63_010951, partial [Diploptera punctata]
NPLVTLLSGLELKDEEIQLFINENIGVETFISLSDDDLIQMGIEDCEKRKSIMKFVVNLRRQGAKKQEEIKRLEPLSWKEASTVLADNSQHMKLLHGVMSYLRSQEIKHKKQYQIDGFLDKDWTCSKALLACAAAAVSQSQCVCMELENLKMIITGENSGQKSRNHRKLLKILAASMGVLGGFLVWRSARMLMQK